MTEHVSSKRALFVVSLDDSEPARRKAFEHARSCEPCARMLRQSQQMLELIDRCATPVVVDEQLAARVKQAVFADRPHTQASSARSRWQPWAWLVGGALSALMVWLDTRPGPSFGTEAGPHCVLFENAYAFATCIAAAVWARTQKRGIDPWSGSLIGMSGALFGQLLLRAHCDSAHAGLHLLAFHVLGVVIGTGLGAVAVPVLTRAR